MKRANVMRVVAVAGALALGPAVCGDYFDGPKLIAADGNLSDALGFAVSVSGDFAIVGASSDDESTGAAYVYRRDGATWIERQKLTASDGEEDEGFGRAVSISGNAVIVGAPNADDRGAAYVFRFNGATWIEEQKLVSGGLFDRFGTSVSIKGGAAVVGAPNDDQGSAYVYRRGHVAWIESQKLVASDGESPDHFGDSVSISGDVVVVGAPNDDDGSGAAYMFRRDGFDWIEEQKITAADRDSSDQFGASVSIDGAVAIVGAAFNDDSGGNSGAAYVYFHVGATWIGSPKLVASDGAAGDVFGTSVSLSGDVAIIGAFGADGDGGSNSGAAYVFRDAGGTFLQEQRLTAADGRSADRFGFSVAIDEGVAIVGAPFSDGARPSSGSAYIHERAVMVGTAAGDQFGRAVANLGDFDGDGFDEIVVGAPFSDRARRNAGEIVVFDGRTFDRLFSKTGQRAGDEFGRAVAGAGDVNRDGVPDIVVGAPGYRNRTGRVSVYSGRDGRLLYRNTGESRGDRFGWSVAGGLDVNDDGRDDFVVGAPKNDDAGGSAGKVYVYSGRNGNELASLRGEARGDRFGWSVGLLRANGDDFADVLVGAPKNDRRRKNAGRAYVFSGKNFRILHAVDGRRAGDQHGYAVAALVAEVGRRDNFVVGAPFFDAGRERSAGQAVVYSGRSGDVLFRRTGETQGDRFGESVGCAGDVERDGRVDVIVGVPRHGAAGRAYVWSGRNGAEMMIVDGTSEGDRFGQAVAGGFFDFGDELADLLIGAPGVDLRATGAGRVHVLRSSQGPVARYEPADDDPGAVVPSSLGTYFPRGDWADELVHLLSQWGAGADDADENGDGMVDVTDLRELLADR